MRLSTMLRRSKWLAILQLVDSKVNGKEIPTGDVEDLCVVVVSSMPSNLNQQTMQGMSMLSMQVFSQEVKAVEVMVPVLSLRINVADVVVMDIGPISVLPHLGDKDVDRCEEDEEDVDAEEDVMLALVEELVYRLM